MFLPVRIRCLKRRFQYRVTHITSPDVPLGSGLGVHPGKTRTRHVICNQPIYSRLRPLWSTGVPS